MTHGAKELAALLPKEPPGELQHWVWAENLDSLGGHFCIFRRESVTAYDRAGIMQTMEPEDWDCYENTKKAMWGARCTCTACHEDFITGYISKGKYGVASGIEIMQGEDGQFYDGVPAMEDEHCWRADTLQLGETDRFNCPFCGQDLCLTRAANLQKGRVYQLLVNSVAVVDGYLVLLYWMARRNVWDWGIGEKHIRPYEAIVLDGNGRQTRYICDAVTGWRVATKAFDPARKRYHSWEAVNHNKANALIWPVLPELTDSTGEKTGIENYIDAGGMWLATYLTLWRQHRNVENLVRHGWGYTLGTAIDEAVINRITGQLGHEIEMRWINWAETKPHRMLGMSKEDFRSSGRWGWSWQEADAWRQYSCYAGDCTAAEFNECRGLLRSDTLQRIVGMVLDGWDLPLKKVVRYLKKQDGGKMMRTLSLQFLDYREMLDAVGGTPTEEELWPRHLVTAHDRLAAVASGGDKAMYTKRMAEIAAKLAPLAWSDGTYCIRVAATPAELTNEGRVLEHCVGTYHKKHCAMTDVVFFVRRTRKPGTPYYTLDIDMKPKIPKEVQLHGYKNEWCKKGGGRRRIPDGVRDFCDRWEREVLLPWFAAHRDAVQEEKKRRNAGKEHIA